MTSDVTKTIHRTAGVAAALAAVLSPIPLADEIALLPVFATLTRRIAKSHDLGWLQTPWRPIGRTTVNGLLARATVNLAVSFIPGVAAVANAASAVLLTQFLGRYIDEACASPDKAVALSPTRIVELLRKKKPPVETAAATTPA